MRRKPYPEREDGMRVWLAPGELDELLDVVAERGTVERVAVELAGRAGLRRGELVEVVAGDVVDGPGGKWLRVDETTAEKGGYRETPIPAPLAARIDAVGDRRDVDEAVVDRTAKSVYRWVTNAGEFLAQKHGDEGWRDLDVHDLRRTWGTHLLEDGVLPTAVMDFGGWTSWEVFRQHYLGELSPRALRRERAKVSYLDSDVDVATDGAGDGRHPAVAPAVATRDHRPPGNG